MFQRFNKTISFLLVLLLVLSSAITASLFVTNVAYAANAGNGNQDFDATRLHPYMKQSFDVICNTNSRNGIPTNYQKFYTENLINYILTDINLYRQSVGIAPLTLTDVKQAGVDNIAIQICNSKFPYNNIIAPDNNNYSWFSATIDQDVPDGSMTAGLVNPGGLVIGDKTAAQPLIQVSEISMQVVWGAYNKVEIVISY